MIRQKDLKLLKQKIDEAKQKQVEKERKFIREFMEQIFYWFCEMSIRLLGIIRRYDV